MSKRKVLIPLDGSEFSRQILRVVRNFFEPGDVELVLFRAAFPPAVTSDNLSAEMFVGGLPVTGSYEAYNRALDVSYHAVEEERQRYRQQLADELQPEVDRLRGVGYVVATHVDYGDPSQCIIDYINDASVDMVAMATHGRSGLGRLVLGSVAERVLRSVEVPVLLMRPAPATTDKPSFADLAARRLGAGRPLQVAVATDGAAPTQHAVEVASSLASLLQTRLTVLVVASERDGSAHAQHVMQSAYRLVEGLELRPEFVPLVGYTDEVVLSYLEKNPKDLLVIGPFQDRGAGSAAAIGPGAQRLVQYAPTSVLVVKGRKNQLRRILVCADVDDSAVVTAAMLFAEGLGAKLDLVHVISPTAANYLATSDNSDNSDMALDQILNQGTHLSNVLQGWITGLAEQGFERSAVHVQRGNMPETALEMAHKGDYDLICVGSRSSAGHFPGSVANSIVRYADGSVLVVRTR